MKTIIKTTELTKCFGTKTAVDHLNLDIYEGEIYGLLGVNGAGKTTTIRMLTGLSAVTEGEAVVMGHSVKTDLQEVKTITNIPHADYADKADYFKTLMTLIALIFFDSENMRKSEKNQKKF